MSCNYKVFLVLSDNLAFSVTLQPSVDCRIYIFILHMFIISLCIFVLILQETNTHLFLPCPETHPSPWMSGTQHNIKATSQHYIVTFNIRKRKTIGLLVLAHEKLTF